MGIIHLLFIFCLLASFVIADKIQAQDRKAQKEKEEDIEENKKGKKA